MTDTITGRHAAKALLAEMPDKPLFLDAFWETPATPAYDPEKPFVVLDPNDANVAVRARPSAAPAPGIGEVVFVHYRPAAGPFDPTGQEFAARLRAAVEAKLAEIEAFEVSAREAAKEEAA